MTSNSSYIYNGSSNGLGQMMVSSSTRNFYDRRRNLQPTLLPVLESGRSSIDSGSPTRTIKPIVATIAPKTGGSYPILTPGSDGGNQPSNETKPGPSFLTFDEDHIVIAGDHRMNKKQAVMVGAGLAGAFILLKYIL